jgi:molybdate transport system ATP-binding protein
MATVAPFFSLQDVTFSQADQHLLSGLSWVVGAAEQWAVLGPNGAGKSSLLAGVAGQLVVSAGRLSHQFLEGDPSCRDSVFGVLPRGSIELVSPALARRVIESVSSFHQSRWHATFEHGVRVAELFEHDQFARVNPFRIDRPPADPQLTHQRDVAILRVGVEDLLERRLLELSHGELRKVLLARALARAPRLLLLDDPWTGLDAASRERMTRLIDELVREGTQVIVATRRADELPASVSRVLLMGDRRIQAQGPRETVLAGYVPEHATEPRAGVPGLPQRSERGTGAEPLVEMHGVRVGYGDSVILDQIDWTVRAGEHWAIVGPNGAGKSTLLSLILGDNLLVYANDVRLFGRRRGSGESVWDLRRQIGWMGPELCSHLPGTAGCLEVVCSGYRGTLGLGSDCSASERDHARAWLDRFGLGATATVPLGGLAEAARRMVLLGRALVGSPRLLLLDEPCQGLDPSHVAGVRSIIDATVAREGVSLLYVTHDWSELPRSISHVLELARGRVVRQGRITR